jgi:hypothetical protein
VNEEGPSFLELPVHEAQAEVSPRMLPVGEPRLLEQEHRCPRPPRLRAEKMGA